MSSLPSTAEPFQHTFKRYERPLIRYAMRIVRDQERARDIVQDTFLRMCESDVAADDPRVGSWLYTVCRNRAIDVRRRDSRMSTMDCPPEVAVEPSGEHQRAVSEVFARADALPERTARVLELRYRQGRSYRQIADTTGMSVSHVGVVLHDGIKFLRKNLSVVAAIAFVVAAGSWGMASSRQPAPPAGFFAHDRPSPQRPMIPVVQRGELPSEGVDPELFYGPELFRGPALPEALERKRVPSKPWQMLPNRAAPPALMDATETEAAPPAAPEAAPPAAKQAAPPAKVAPGAPGRARSKRRGVDALGL